MRPKKFPKKKVLQSKSNRIVNFTISFDFISILDLLLHVKYFIIYLKGDLELLVNLN